MALTNIQYYAALGKMRNEASTIAAGVRKTNALPNSYRFTVTDFQEDVGNAVLFFSMPDFYLKGIGVENSRTLYTFYQSGYNIIGYNTAEQNFGCEYNEMGWNKSISTITVTIDDLNLAFYQICGGSPNNAAFRNIVIAFAEGFRFAKIATKVVAGEAIADKELDWSAAGATVYQGP
jgi:hypothetical protein